MESLIDPFSSPVTWRAPFLLLKTISAAQSLGRVNICVMRTLLLFSALVLGGSVDAEQRSGGNGYCSQPAQSASVAKWVQVDVGASQTIDEIRLLAAKPPGETPGYGFPPRLQIEISQDHTFHQAELLVDLTAGDFQNPKAEPFVITVNHQNARYLRVTAKKLKHEHSGYVFALADLQVFSQGTNVALHSKVTALDSVETNGWSAKFLVDGRASADDTGRAIPTTDREK